MNESLINKIIITIFIIIISILIIPIICIIIINTTTKPFSTKRVVKEIKDTKDTVSVTSTTNYVQSINYYSELSLVETAGYDVKIPTNSNSNVICTTKDGINWNGTVDKDSSTCTNFMNAIKKIYSGVIPNEAKIELDINGKVVKGSWIKINNLYCTYDVDITCNSKLN